MMDRVFLSLGDLMALARRQSGQITQWLATCDPAALARLEADAVAAGESVASHARARLAGFCRLADDEAWVHALSCARAGGDAGQAFLMAVLDGPVFALEAS
ncbi:MAG: hypothetical protein MUC44_06820 [Beijerinckiaceae bacterium]|jgi:hypothetical protein|nr:hypothetical protein [Beijerinckiaceae bacterium]